MIVSLNRSLSKSSFGSSFRSRRKLEVPEVHGKPVGEFLRENKLSDAIGRKVFNIIDADGSGLVDADEYSTFCQRLGDMDDASTVSFSRACPVGLWGVNQHAVAVGGVHGACHG